MSKKIFDPQNCELSELVKFIERLGYIQVSQEGSHMKFKKDNITLPTIPNKPLSDGTRRNIIKVLFSNQYEQLKFKKFAYPDWNMRINRLSDLCI